jgi:hypothetical protein
MPNNRFSTTRFGLTERDTFLLISTLNGVGLTENMQPTAEWLSGEIFAAAEESHIDLKEFDMDLGTGESNPELPYELNDLFEKTKKLSDWEAAALYYYVRGFFDGQDWVLKPTQKSAAE